MKTWTIVASLALIVFGVACMFDVQESVFSMSDDFLGASGFPRIVGTLLVLASIGLIIQTAARGKAGEPLSGKADGQAVWALVISVGYVLGISHLGFAISTFVYLLLLSLLFDRFKLTNIKGILAYSISLTLVAFFFFKFFKVYLPDTILF